MFYTSVAHLAETIMSAVKDKDSYALCEFFQINSQYTNKQTFVYLTKSQLNSARQILKTPWNDMVLSHLKTIELLTEDDFMSAYKEQAKCFLVFLKTFSHQKSWILPLMYRLCLDIIALANKVDRIHPQESVEEEKQMQAAWYVNKAFSACITDNDNQEKISRKWGTYRMANMLFSLYFKLGTFHLCKNVVRAIEASALPAFERFSLADKVHYNYHLGVLAFHKEAYPKASSYLSYALKHVYAKSIKNQMLILKYLIPSNMVNGKIPSTRLLEKYSEIDAVYSQFVGAFRAGNIQLYDQTLESMQSMLFKSRTYLAMEKARELVLRTLLKKIYLIAGSTRVPVSTFQMALKIVGYTLSEAEVVCLLSVQINKGLIKGYISEAHNTVVLSKANPFPLPKSAIGSIKQQ